MFWISQNIDRTLEIVVPHWDDFVNKGGYDNIKYPEKVYEDHLVPDEISNKWVKESLIWKYGKWNQYINGNSIPSTQEKAIKKFTDSLNILISLKNLGKPSRCQETLEPFPATSSIFLSHLMFPGFWAIVDQHNVRFLHWVHLQVENCKIESSSPWNVSKELNEFQSTLANKLNTTKREIDKFMMSFGKKLRRGVEVLNFKNKNRSIVNKIHFKEIDWIIYFPSKGNEGRQLVNFGVAYRDRVNKITQPGRRINLGNVLSLPAIRGRYPHCIGLFQDASGKGQNWTPAYIESRVIQSEEELLEWIAQIERK